jgi:hypothetical protein
MANQLDGTVAVSKAYTGASGNVVVSAVPVKVTGITLTGGAGVTTYRVYDNATTNSGTVLFAATMAAGASRSWAFPVVLEAVNGVTINASAAGAAGSVQLA